MKVLAEQQERKGEWCTAQLLYTNSHVVYNTQLDTVLINNGLVDRFAVEKHLSQVNVLYCTVQKIITKNFNTEEDFTGIVRQ